MELEQISYAKTVYGQEEIDAVVKCLSESTQMGNYSRKFEKRIAELFDKQHCLYVNSGSSALFIEVVSERDPINRISSETLREILILRANDAFLNGIDRTLNGACKIIDNRNLLRLGVRK